MLLKHYIALLICAFLFLAPKDQLYSIPPVQHNDDFVLIKSRVVQELLKPPIIDRDIGEILTLLQADGSFSDINYDDLSRRAGFPHRRHTGRMVDLSRAYVKEGSSFQQDQRLLDHITLALNYWVDHDFFGDNWHNNQISTPTNLVNVMLLVGDRLPEKLVAKAQPMIGRAHMNASGARPSGDRIVIAGILAKNLLFIGDRKEFDRIIRIIEGEIKFSTGRRGMQHDYSFHHRVDRVNNTVSYGYGKYANAFGEWSYYVSGTKYAFAQEKINHLVDYYLEGIYPQLVYGIYPDISVKNRSISHRQTFEPKGTVEIERLLLSTDYRREELQEIIQLRRGDITPTQSFCKFFWQTEHFVFQRPNFYTTVRMFSTRNQNMEVPYNGPGKTTHHRADGTNYLVRRGDEYLNIWPVYDWQKISGSTIMQKPHLPDPAEIRKEGLTEFVGAVEDGLHGAVAFDFRSPHDGLTARKSWFFFEDEYICLGTAIQSRPDLPVYTTINQTLLESEVNVSIHGSIKTLQPGFHALKDVTWIHHDGIAYIPITPQTYHLSNDTQKGRWSDITDQKNISTTLVEKDVFSLWIDHGTSPDSGAYSYMVVPDVSVGELSEGSLANRNIEILSNNSDLQAVKDVNEDIYQLAFYRAGSINITDQQQIALTSQGMIMLKRNKDGSYQLSVADPSRKLNTIVLSLSGYWTSPDAKCETIRHQTNDITTILVELPQGHYLGKSKSVSIRAFN